MKVQNCIPKLTIAISPEEKEQAKTLARAKGMTFQGWLALVVRTALKEAKEAGDEA